MFRVSRPVLFILMATAVLFTAVLAYTLMSGDDRDTRSGRALSEETDAAPDRDAPAEAPTDGPGGKENKGSVRVFLVTGRVEDLNGRPIEAATVIASGKRTITDGRGAYRIMSPVSYIAFDVYATGYLPFEGTLNGFPMPDRLFVCEGGGPWSKDFILRPAASLSGRLFDPDRRPVAGARVYVLSPDHALLEETRVGNLVHSDKEGYFRFPGLPPGTYDLGVRAEGFLPELRRDVVIGESGVVERILALKRGRTVRVTVHNGTDGTRVIAADARLKQRLLPPGGVDVLADALVGREYVGVPVVNAQRDQGRYMLRGVAAGPADIAALDARRITEPGVGKVVDNTEATLELTLITATEIEIRVVDDVTKKPLDPAVFRVTDREKPLKVTYVAGAATVPADRRSHTLLFRLQGYEEARLELPPHGTKWPGVFEVTMRPASDGETGGFTLEFEKPVADRVALVGRDAEGRAVWTKHLSQASPKDVWAVAGVPFGEYQVSVMATSQVPVIIPRVVVAKGLNERHRIRLIKGGGIEMKVTDSAGKLLDKVGFILKDAAGNQIDVHVMMYLSDRRAFVSVNSLPLAATARADSGLAPGAYSLTAYRSGYEPATQEFVVQGREVAKVTIVLPTR